MNDACRYQVQFSDFAENDGRTLLVSYFESSPIKLLQAVFPDFSFLPFLFSQTPEGFWDKLANQKEYIRWLMSTVSLTDPKDLRIAHFQINHGSALLSRYNNSVQSILSAVIENSAHEGERGTDPSPSYTPKNHWTTLENQREYLRSLASKLGFSFDDFERWYLLSQKDLIENGGRGLLNKYNGSLYELLREVIPEVDWLPWKFTVLPSAALDDPLMLKKVVAYAEESLNLKSRDDW